MSSILGAVLFLRLRRALAGASRYGMRHASAAVHIAQCAWCAQPPVPAFPYAAHVPALTRTSCMTGLLHVLLRRLESVALVMQNCMLEDMLDNEEQLTEQLEALPYLVGFGGWGGCGQGGGRGEVHACVRMRALGGWGSCMQVLNLRYVQQNWSDSPLFKSVQVSTWCRQGSSRCIARVCCSCLA